jgi:hypothetical protein
LLFFVLFFVHLFHPRFEFLIEHIRQDKRAEEEGKTCEETNEESLKLRKQNNGKEAKKKEQTNQRLV